jgi:hypothetical protein
MVYKLGLLLESLGHKVSFVPQVQTTFYLHRADYPKELLLKFIAEPAEADPDSIAIIPETTPDEILQSLPSRNRVFYLLNRPYLLTGKPLLYRPEDLVVAYSGLISKAYFNLFITNEISEFSPIENQCLNQPEKENIILFYFGKSRHDKVPAEIKRLIRKHRSKVIVINRIFPKCRRTLFDLLRRARLVVSFDPLTNLCYEATLCGTPCFIADNYMKLNYADFNFPLTGFFEDPSQADSYFSQGIEPREHAAIIKRYHDTYAANSERVEQFVHLCREWFSLIMAAQTDPQKTALLAMYNQMRLERDRVAYAISGGTRIDDAFHNYSPLVAGATAFEKFRLYMAHRTHRLVWNAQRNWHKHIRRLQGAALESKLEAMRAAYETHKYGSQLDKSTG